MVRSRHGFRAVKFYSAIENVDGFSSRETQFYPQGVDISTIDRASQAEYEGSIPFTRSSDLSKKINDLQHALIYKRRW